MKKWQYSRERDQALHAERKEKERNRKSIYCYRVNECNIVMLRDIDEAPREMIEMKHL